MSDIVVPQWGLTTDEATLNEWLKVVGDYVEQGEPIAELETDKTVAALESPFAGTITDIFVPEGSEVVPGQVVAKLSDD